MRSFILLGGKRGANVGVVSAIILGATKVVRSTVSIGPITTLILAGHVFTRQGW